MSPEKALEKAIETAGGQAALARLLSNYPRNGRKTPITRQAVDQWTICPPLWVLAVESLTGVPRQDLRQDLYPQ